MTKKSEAEDIRANIDYQFVSQKGKIKWQKKRTRSTNLTPKKKKRK